MLRDSASLLDINRAGQLVVEFSQGMTREDLELNIFINLVLVEVIPG